MSNSSTNINSSQQNISLTRVCIIDDEVNMCQVLKEYLKRLKYSVSSFSNSTEALEALTSTHFDFVLLDVRMPNIDGFGVLERLNETSHKPVIIMMSAYGSLDLAIDAMKKGAYDYISKPFKLEEVQLVLRKAQERENLKKENARLKQKLLDLDSENKFSGMIGVSDESKNIFKICSKLSQFDSPVLITGESGVGKELVARSIHNLGRGKNAPFIAVNCGGIPESLLESEFFGYEKGAFTGAAKDHIGIFEAANHGTVFLDEIGEMPLGLQVKLLRVLQEGEIRRVGSVRSKKIEVRVLSATNKDLIKMIENGTFRNDLYYRLNTFTIQIKPLRERAQDIIPLAKFFISKFCQSLNRQDYELTKEAAEYLLTREWNGNARELKSAIEKAIILSDSTILDVCDFDETRKESTFQHTLLNQTFSLKDGKRIVEVYLIEKALKHCNGNKTKASELLDVSYPALLEKLKLYDIQYNFKS